MLVESSFYEGFWDFGSEWWLYHHLDMQGGYQALVFVLMAELALWWDVVHCAVVAETFYHNN